MSYEIVKSIRITDGKVFVTSKSNNDTAPIHEWHCSFFDGKSAEFIDLEIMKSFEGGTFQSNRTNKWTNALKVLFANPEYAKYDWRKGTYDDDCPIRIARQTEDFDKLLLTSLNMENK